MSGDVDGALEHLLAAHDIRQATNTLNTVAGADLLTNIGVAKKGRGDLKGAMESYKAAETIREATGTLRTPAGERLLRNIQRVRKSEIGRSI
eukprot:gnl/TRDRNA2_/TRDRNA2_144152_c4_seq1.p2 gnl/TRDRNA2_/TRDRNA2_144152_c4~~gnl/TRDRNA2_/TRDRNA2_144152_c4_seq1.p2  ORF type:complete len:103 (-),score=23.39 gnl/TRDRNA2_/TRDRNA2_144152_c4_seq1:21-296(-)